MPPVIHILPDHQAVSRAIADRLIAFVAARPGAVLALPSGNTPVEAYARVAEAVEAGRVSFAEATVFGLDEYRGIPPEDPRAFRHFFETHVFGPFGLAPTRSHGLDGLAPDPELEAARYEALIRSSGGLWLTLLGLGGNGHIAFNEPAPTLQARTHVALLAPPSSRVAPEGITMGVGTLLSAPEVWLMATGESKAEAVARMLGGAVDPACPASLLQVHPHAEIYLDQAAASRL